ncbi:formate dehydrogenase accessory sulfurtransferase FdhD [Selenihalanaerobacter shriftii]|uniref:Sulfur carrier protein FdhD n=1 Tax=Selenihalanaerobacter shriftii TaxID=142842 RepID=A0A1T4NQZ7_9FIRM|nr:formate dehydrogenase accessory sulfurtransferase FdhD [Selenihalanaerobacter shriftii]SJZ81721.1 FdhD protein [Selenihalanaerobacter shriftii]
MKELEEITVLRASKEGITNLADAVVTEMPLTIILNDEEIVTLLCTPLKLDYLALGFLKSEGLINDKGDVKKVEVDQEDGIVRVETKDNTSSLVEKLYGKRTITSGCGKGTIFYNVIDSLQCNKIELELEIEVDMVLKLVRELQQRAELFQETGGSHSSALCTPKETLIFNEDIGRHNAVDKIVGETIMKDLKLNDKLLVTSGRVSSEILLKTAKLGLSILISRAAPTSLTVNMADELGITLIGFARGRRMNIYTHDWRVKR